MEFSVYFQDLRPLCGGKLDDAMAPFSRIWFLPFFSFVGLCPPLGAQNLVPNSSFEVFTFCPPGFGSGGPLQATPWQSGSGGTSDYLNVCANPVTVGVPVNFFGNEPAHTGVAYGGSYYKYFAFEYREYLTCPLLGTLSAGVLYHISFYISLGDNNCGVDKMGVYFSNTAPVWPPSSHMPVTPQFEAQLGYLSNTDGWTLIDGCYTASGGEHWITIGNFYDDANSPIDPNCPLQVNNSYYYVDDVSIDSAINIQNLNFDLGGPIEACDSFVIDPGLSGVSYFWSDGSHGPTLTVTESGTYALTISSGCDAGNDEIDVTINGNHPPVDLGSPQVDLCSGDSYTISLDPDAGDYTWQDGSTDPEYTITSTGTYSVTLDDGGCDQTNDQVQVDVIEPPAPFDLGPDTYVCPGNEITYSFDPS
ncbi:MAG TPA: hypothetical protein VJ508_10095, partial [Saprospiraceae bacterium]|nr:hypothetical protein [Saprospiraceae bacterium]